MKNSIIFILLCILAYVISASIYRWWPYKKVEEKTCEPAIKITGCSNLGLNVDMAKFNETYAILHRIISSVQYNACQSYNVDKLINDFKSWLSDVTGDESITCKNFNEGFVNMLEKSKDELNLSDEDSKFIKILEDLYYSIFKELCKEGDDDDKTILDKFSIIAKEILESLCPMEEIKKNQPLDISDAGVEKLSQI